MNKNKNTGYIIVEALLQLVATLFMLVPLILGLYFHNGWLMVGVVLGALGGAVKTALHD